VSSGGLVPAMALAESSGLRELADQHLSVPTDKGANAGLKVSSLVSGMVAGADSIDDMALLRLGGMGRVFGHAYAPSTLGSFLRAFTFGHVRQLDAVASRFVAALAGRSPLVGEAGDGEFVLVDVDDTIIEVHGYAKQGAGFGYCGVRGLNAPLAAGRWCGPTRRSTDAAWCWPRSVPAPRSRSPSARTSRSRPRSPPSTPMPGPRSKTPTRSGTRQPGGWISRAEVAEVPFTAFASRKKAEQVPGRLVVRRIPDLNTGKNKTAGQETLFDIWRFHAFFTTTPAEVTDTVTADKTHRGHAIIEQVNADLKNSALAHLPSGVFANAA
jgi:hypothetical protein